MPRFTVFDVETLNCMSADGITVITRIGKSAKRKIDYA